MDSGNIYGIPAAISTFLYLALALIVLRVNPRSRLNRIAALFFCLLSFWSFSEWMLRWSDTHDSAFFWAWMIFIPIILLPPVIIHLSSIFPWSHKKVQPHIYGFYGLSLILLAAHMTPKVFISDVERYYAGYGTLLGTYGIYVYLYLALFGLAAIIILMIKYTKIESGLALHQLKIFIIAFSISYIFVFFTGFMPNLYGNMDIYPWTTPSFLVMGSVLAYAIHKYHVFVPLPEREVERRPETGCSGIKILPPEEAMSEFYEKVRSGYRGICITAKDPREWREEMDLEKVPVIDIKETVDVKSAHGKNMIPFIITDISMTRSTVIILDAFEEIFSKEEFREFIDDLKSMEPKESMVIVSRGAA